MDSPYVYKIVVIGDTNVGKSNIITRFTQNFFDENPHTTIGVEFFTKNVTIIGRDKKPVEVSLQIWDTAGQERFRGIASSYYKSAKGIILVYEITNAQTFENLKKWMDEIKSHGESYIDLVLLGNKCDLVKERVVQRVNFL